VERKRAAGLAIALLGAASVACATRVWVDFDPREDFRSYRTWTWLAQSWEVAAAGSRVDPELDALLRGAIERELVSRGYERAAAEAAPDFLVTYHVQLRRQLVQLLETPAMQTLHNPHREGGYEVTASRARLQFYEFGTLVLDVAEAKDGQLVWRGIGTRKVRESFKRQAAAVVTDIFEGFPPDPESGS
jgi:hypothetical protein